MTLILILLAPQSKFGILTYKDNDDDSEVKRIEDVDNQTDRMECIDR